MFQCLGLGLGGKMQVVWLDMRSSLILNFVARWIGAWWLRMGRLSREPWRQEASDYDWYRLIDSYKKYDSFQVNSVNSRNFSFSRSRDLWHCDQSWPPGTGVLFWHFLSRLYQGHLKYSLRNVYEHLLSPCINFIQKALQKILKPAASLVQVHGTSDIHDTVMTLWLQPELQQLLSTTISMIAFAFQRGMTSQTTSYGQRE